MSNTQVGAEELAPEEYRAASELRGRLTSAARVKAQLEGALKALLNATLPGAGPRGRALEQLAEPVAAAIREAARCVACCVLVWWRKGFKHVVHLQADHYWQSACRCLRAMRLH
jgi:hypothetical protein